MTPAASLPRARRAAVALALALGALVGIAAPAAAAPTPTPDLGAAAAPERTAAPTVLVGVAGLRWTDVGRSTTPTLWTMIDEGAVASMSVGLGSTAICPLDAWTALSAGRRLPAVPGTAPDVGTPPDEPTPGEPAEPGDAGCAPLPVVVPDDAASVGPATVADWPALAPAPDATDTPVTGPGQLGTLLAEAGTCTTAVGPGAAVMLADAQGRVERYAASLEDLEPADLTACEIVVIDKGVLPDNTTDRKAAREALDDDLSRLLDELPRGSRTLVAGIADTTRVRLDYQVVVDWSSRAALPRWLTSASTKRQGLVQLTDLTATLAADGNATSERLDGETLVRGDLRRMSVARTVENRRYLDVLSTTIETLMPALVGGLAVVLLATLGGTLAARRAAARRGETDLPPRERGRGIVAAIALLAASVPVAASLATLSRWWVWRAPTLALTMSLTVSAVAVAILAWVVSRFLPRSPMRLATAVAGITWLVLTVDGLTGTTLQQGSLLGPSPRFGARFYGFNNMTFAVYAAAALLVAGSLATLVARVSRRLAVTIVLVVGLVTTVVDGWPAFGADFGGILALIPSFAVLALVTAQARITPRRLLAIAAATVGTVAAVSIVDWVLPGSSHLGKFVQRVVDGDALSLIGTKATGAWATVAHPGGIVVALAFAAAVYAALRPERCRLPEVTDAYERVPLLRPIVLALVVAAVLGSVLNDSGIIIAIVFLLVSVAVLVATFLAEEAAGAGALEEAAVASADKAGNAVRARDLGGRRMPTTVLTIGGGMLTVSLLVAFTVPGASTAVTAGDVPSTPGVAVAQPGDDVVVIGTAGLRPQDISPTASPTLWELLRDSAAAGSVTASTFGQAGACTGAGWLALSAGRPPVVGTARAGEWTCTPWAVQSDGRPEGGGASIVGWPALSALQSGSSYKPTLGVLGETINATSDCATAIGPGAALALADTSGAVAHYRELSDLRADPDDALSCAITLIDAGSAPYHPSPGAYPGTTANGRARQDAVRQVDRTIREILNQIPPSTKVLVVDVGNPAPGRAWLGFALSKSNDQTTPRFLSSTSTRWEGVVRLLDYPLALVSVVDAKEPVEFSGAPPAESGERPQDTAVTVDQLSDLAERDHALRVVTGTVTLVPLYLGLALFAFAAFALPRVRHDKRSLSAPLTRYLNAAFLVLAALPASLFLMTTWSWWRFDPMGRMLWLSLALSTVTVAGLAALRSPRNPWARPASLSLIVFVVMTLDAVLGTPLHRGSPLGPAPTLGGRYYGFGNPSYSVYVVAALVTAVTCATYLLERNRKAMAVAAASVIGLVAFVVDLWPSFGADVGGGLVLAPVFAFVVLAVAGIRLTWRRIVIVGLGGVLVVALFGVLDWLRPVSARSHLGAFVQSVIDGTAWETIARKAGFAAKSLTAGFPAWLTLAVLVVTVVAVWSPRLRPRWLTEMEQEWPLLRPLLAALIIAAVAGGIVNDYGVRITTIMLFTAVPLAGLLLVSHSRGSASRAP